MSLIANDGSNDCNIQTLNQLIMEFYLAPFNQKHLCSIQLRMIKMFEKKIATDQESDIIEIFKTCLRDYASELLQEFSEENFKQVEHLWEIHYRLQATSLKTEKLYEMYYGLFKFKTPCPYDFFEIHFDTFNLKLFNKIILILWHHVYCQKKQTQFTRFKEGASIIYKRTHEVKSHISKDFVRLKFILKTSTEQ